MSSVLYYSNFCQNSKNLLQTLSKSKLKEDIHYFCIDNRVTKSNGAIYIILQNNQEIILPPNITKVPALMLLKEGHRVIFGAESILRQLEPQEREINQKAVQFNGEPFAFSFGGSGGGLTGVASDHYSFLDQNAESLSAKGNGGMRQLYHYATLDYVDTIQTPPDNYVPDKIGEVSMEKLQQQRNLSFQK
jgi:hypothetical protein